MGSKLGSQDNLQAILTETNLLVVSDSGCGLLGQDFFGVKEDATLSLEGSLSLKHSQSEKFRLPVYLPSLYLV